MLFVFHLAYVLRGFSANVISERTIIRVRAVNRFTLGKIEKKKTLHGGYVIGHEISGGMCQPSHACVCVAQSVNSLKRGVQGKHVRILKI